MFSRQRRVVTTWHSSLAHQLLDLTLYIPQWHPQVPHFFLARNPRKEGATSFLELQAFIEGLPQQAPLCISWLTYVFNVGLAESTTCSATFLSGLV
ncbi:hypothetical protein CC2G_007757 [Coprinopsis cinerea AmutBmut pab1-1]|nr:hypothetical protein CC2G_007757 [Coprinopsis cinerea AmutBmut pab1-1]